MRLAYFDCFSGISGDMTLGAFLDSGLSFDKLSSGLDKLKMPGYKIKKTAVSRSGISGMQFECLANNRKRAARPVKDIIAMIDSSGISRNAKKISKDIFLNIAAAEAKIHGLKTVLGVHLHEIGDIDSIVDIVGCAIAVDELGIDEVWASVVSMGRAFVKVSHGTLPIPAPASIELLRGAPVRMLDVESELVTPTGAGILKTLCKGYGGMPVMKIDSVGYGAGTNDLADMPNMLRIVIGESRPVYAKDRVTVMEANIDDMSPQHFEYLFEKLFAEGAIDAYVTNIQMKKTRPAYKLTVLADNPKVPHLSSVIFAETTTIGIRFSEADRFKLRRESVKVKTKFGDVIVKISSGPEGLRTAAPEYEECAKLARTQKIPLKTVIDEAKAAVRI